MYLGLNMLLAMVVLEPQRPKQHMPTDLSTAAGIGQPDQLVSFGRSRWIRKTSPFAGMKLMIWDLGSWGFGASMEIVSCSAAFGIEKYFSIFSVHIELVSFAFDIEKWYWEYWEDFTPS
jgi:hypothetical protein